MSSSKAWPNVPPPTGGKAQQNNSYSRFIPREELSGFSAWMPGDLSGELGTPARRPGVQKPAPPAEPQKSPEQLLAEHVAAARQGGYHDGYRDGLAALESFKQSFAQQLAGQLGALLQSTGASLDAMQQQMARTLAASAVALARQVVRRELQQQPEAIVDVAIEAVDALLLSARHVTLRVHPDELALVAQGAADVIAARGVRVVADPAIARGGCLVDSDIGSIDATIETRWRRAAAALGDESVWGIEAAEAPSPQPSPASGRGSEFPPSPRERGEGRGEGSSE